MVFSFDITMDPMLHMSTRVKRKRVVLTLSQKIDICKRLKAGENKHVLMKDFNVGASTLYDISRQEKRLMEFVGIPALRKACEYRHTLHQPKLKELDIVLFDWFEKEKSEGNQITGPMLREKAKELYVNLNITAKCGFSEGWLARFKVRHGINRSDLSSDRKLSDYDGTPNFSDSSEQANTKAKYPSENIYDIDGSSSMWQDLSSITQLNVKNESACDVQHDPDTTYTYESVDIKNEQDPLQCESIQEPDNTTDDKNVSWSSAASSFANILSFAESEQCFSEQDLTQLHILHSTFHYKMKKLCKTKLY